MGKYLADSYDAALRESADLKTRLAEAEQARDSAFETWKKFHQDTLAAFIKNEHEPLKARLAEAEALLRECRHFVKALCDHDDATCGCYQHIVLRGIDAFLAADSAPAVHDCGKPLKLGQHGECVWCGYMPDKNYPSDQPEAAVK